MHMLLFLILSVSVSCFAAPPAIEQQARALQTLLRQADEAYYNQHESVLSDAAYDALRQRYDQLLADYPELSAENPIGVTAHHPRSAVARKYKEVPVQTRLPGVDWSRAESGRVTPVARFEPAEIQGATIQRATRHNLDYIRSMDLKISDWIDVIRSGGNVPEISGVCVDRRTGAEPEIAAPEEIIYGLFI